MKKPLFQNNNWIVLSVFTGIIVFVSCLHIFDLPTLISRGNQAQKTIQMLDKMRHPFLAIEATKAELVRSSNISYAETELSKANNAARSLLLEYKRLAQYNPEVSSLFDELLETYSGWLMAVQHLFSDYKTDFPKQLETLETKTHIIKDLGLAELSFLETMNKLAEAEVTIHRDIDKGRWANNIVLSSIIVFFLYLISLIIFQQYFKARELKLQVEYHTRTLNKKTKFLQILQSITAKANETSSFDDVMQYTLDQICLYTDWPIGHVYIQDEKNNQKMIPTQLWHIDDPDNSREFQRVTEETTFNSGIGLPGRVFASQEPAWVNDVTKDTNFPRNKLVTNIGVKAAFAFPIIHNSIVVAVLEFFSYEACEEPKERHKDVINHIGVQIGHTYGRLHAEKALRHSEEQWRLTFDSTSDYISLHDKEMRFLKVNKSLANFLGKQPDELLGKYCYDEFNCSESQIQCCISIANKNKEITEIIDDVSIGIPLLVTKSPVLDDKGSITGHVHVARDITERREFEKRLEHLAHYDHLTGLPNRTLFIDRTEQIIARAPWNNRIMAIFYLDLDRFKLLNDTYGHDCGDTLLREVANRLKKIVRKGDTVTRLGGDEFAISLIDVARKEDVEMIANKINQSLAEPFSIDGWEVFVTTSIGISLFPNDSNNIIELLKYADVAMYGAKAKGKNTYLFYTPDTNILSSKKIEIENDLRHALEHNEFVLYYQPRIDIKTGQIAGMEALLRWQSKRHGLVQPDMFIPFLEDTGLIVPVGEWVIKTASKQNKMWQQSGYTDLCVSVNVSARQFIQNNLIENVNQALAENELEPQYLELELTESILLEYMEETQASLNELEKLGVKLTIDDFGTGYSSLGYLRNFPIHALKIDKSFITDVTTNKNDAALTKAIISIAKNLNLSVTAEGVETSEQLDFLISNKCNQLQGYLYSKPLTVNDFTKLLQDEYQLDVNKETKRSKHLKLSS